MMQMNKKLQAAEQLRRAMQMFAASLDDEKALEVATLYPAYKVGITYSAGEIIRKGVNTTGDPQLYKIAQAHTSQADWPPESTPALYTPLGLTESGYPVWSRPSGAHDAYNKGDIVDFNGTLKRSTIDGNTWSPDEYPGGWETFEEV